MGYLKKNKRENMEVIKEKMRKKVKEVITGPTYFILEYLESKIGISSSPESISICLNILCACLTNVLIKMPIEKNECQKISLVFKDIIEKSLNDYFEKKEKEDKDG